MNSALTLRTATANDCKMIFEWANDPVTRAMSGSPKAISWEEHTEWFNRKLRDPNCLFLIGQDENRNPIGQVRFQSEGTRATLSVSICPMHRGKGHGTALVQKACARAWRSRAIQTIDAYVKQENIQSLRLFDKAGFRKIGDIMRDGCLQTHFSMTAPSFTINDRKIGKGNPAYFVAEMSGNHNHDFDRAVRLIHAMKEAGADAVKLQTYTADTITIDSDRPEFLIGKGTVWEGRRLHEFYQEAMTPWEWHPKLQKVAKDVGLDFFSAPFDPTAVDFLEEMDVPAYKIASYEIVDLPLIRKAASTGKPVILSAGIASLEEIEEAIAAAQEGGASGVALLKCTNAYPAPPEEVNLLTIPDLAERFNVVMGISDHTLGIAVPVAAIALDAHIIEKHFILSRNDGGPDNAFSLEPQEFKAMVEECRIAEKALGNVDYEDTEKAAACRVFRRSLYVVKNMKKGDLFTEETVRSIRPANGLVPKHLPSILGKKASCAIKKGTPLAQEMVA